MLIFAFPCIIESVPEEIINRMLLEQRCTSWHSLLLTISTRFWRVFRNCFLVAWTKHSQVVSMGKFGATQFCLELWASNSILFFWGTQNCTLLFWCVNNFPTLYLCSLCRTASAAWTVPPLGSAPPLLQQVSHTDWNLALKKQGEKRAPPLTVAGNVFPWKENEARTPGPFMQWWLELRELLTQDNEWICVSCIL